MKKKRQYQLAGADGGFTLMDILIAIVVISIGLWGTLEAFHRSSISIRNAEIRCRVNLAAESMAAYLERVGYIEDIADAEIPEAAGAGRCSGIRWELQRESQLDSGEYCRLTVKYPGVVLNEHMILLRRNEL